MSIEVVIIDYGIGNLFSVRRAFEHCGAKVEVTDDKAKILSAQRVVLPGVGAFTDGMRGLGKLGLDNIIKSYIASGRPLLGICLGMQMLCSVSEEFGETKGLGIIPGQVSLIPNIDLQGNPLKIPHVGWADLQLKSFETIWKGTILDGLSSKDAIYLTHSFAVKAKNRTHLLAYCDYGGNEISAVIRKENVYGVQFHPEKSGPIGLKIINNFMNL